MSIYDIDRCIKFGVGGGERKEGVPFWKKITGTNYFPIDSYSQVTNYQYFQGSTIVSIYILVGQIKLRHCVKAAAKYAHNFDRPPFLDYFLSFVNLC